MGVRSVANSRPSIASALRTRGGPGCAHGAPRPWGPLRVDAGRPQGVALQVQRLGAVGFPRRGRSRARVREQRPVPGARPGHRCRSSRGASSPPTARAPASRLAALEASGSMPSVRGELGDLRPAGRPPGPAHLVRRVVARGRHAPAPPRRCTSDARVPMNLTPIAGLQRHLHRRQARLASRCARCARRCSNATATNGRHDLDERRNGPADRPGGGAPRRRPESRTGRRQRSEVDIRPVIRPTEERPDPKTAPLRAGSRGLVTARPEAVAARACGPGPTGPRGPGRPGGADGRRRRSGTGRPRSAAARRRDPRGGKRGSPRDAVLWGRSTEDRPTGFDVAVLVEEATVRAWGSAAAALVSVSSDFSSPKRTRTLPSLPWRGFSHGSSRENVNQENLTSVPTGRSNHALIAGLDVVPVLPLSLVQVEERHAVAEQLGVVVLMMIV